jgi:hypothetical protein
VQLNHQESIVTYIVATVEHEIQRDAPAGGAKMQPHVPPKKVKAKNTFAWDLIEFH